jgi:hypothetical protein
MGRQVHGDTPQNKMVTSGAKGTYLWMAPYVCATSWFLATAYCTLLLLQVLPPSVPPLALDGFWLTPFPSDPLQPQPFL